MGAFLLLRKPEGNTVEQVEKQYNNSLGVFEKKGLSLNKRIIGDDFILYTFHKYKYPVENTVFFDNNQFIVSTGTLIYNRKIGRGALADLYRDFSVKSDFLLRILGQFAVILYKNGNLYLFNDYTGVYHICHNSDKTVISSSFLAVSRALNKRTVSTQELYEYLTMGSSFGGKTIISEIEQLDSKNIWQLSPVIQSIPKPPPQPPLIKRLNGNRSLEETVEAIGNDLIDYFSIIRDNFGNDISTALTGGVHTRLLLGSMKRNGIRPSYLYIFGKEGHTVGRDANAVEIAQSIVKKEGFNLDVIDIYGQKTSYQPDKFRDLIKRCYYLGDGLGHERGIFDDYDSLLFRLRRIDHGRLTLNGGGGEELRNYWNLPDRPYYIDSFINVKYDHIDPGTCTDSFDRNSFFTALREKIKASLGTTSNLFTRTQIELIQPEFENRFWMGNNNSINNMISYSLTPLADLPFAWRACDIPIKLKNMSLFEGNLMKFIDPELARFPTSQGVDLYNNRVSFKDRVKYNMVLNMPFWLRAYIRKNFYFQMGERLRIGGDKFDTPFYFKPEYLTGIFGSGEFNVSQYVHLDKISNPQTLSRALTAEMVIGDPFNK